MANLGFVKKAYPFIHALASLGGPPAVMVTDLVGRAIGVDNAKIDPTPEGISQAIQDAGFTPEQRAALMQAELAAKQESEKMGFQNLADIQKLDNEDRANARAREISVKDHTTEVGFYLITAGFFGTLLFVAIHGINPQVHDLVVAMLSSLGTAWVASINYFYGSSKGQDAQGKALADIAKS